RGSPPHPGARRRGAPPPATDHAEPRDGGGRRDGRVRRTRPSRRRLPRAGAARGADHRGRARRRAAGDPRAHGGRSTHGGGHPRDEGRDRASPAVVTVVTAAEMRALDRWTIEHGTPGAVLMERAGGGAARVLRTRLRAARGPVVVLCGRGNNGGDGFVIARHLRRARVPVEVWLAAHPAEVRGDAADMLAAWRR